MLLESAKAATYLIARIMYDARVVGHAALETTAPGCLPISRRSALATVLVSTMTLEAATAATYPIAGVLYDGGHAVLKTTAPGCLPISRGSALATGMMPMMVGIQPPKAIKPSIECPAMFLRALMGRP